MYLLGNSTLLLAWNIFWRFSWIVWHWRRNNYYSNFFYVFSYLGFPQEILSHMVLGSSLGVIVFSSISSTFSHNTKGAVNWGLIKLVVPSIVIGSCLGSLTAGYLESNTLQAL